MSHDYSRFFPNAHQSCHYCATFSKRFKVTELSDKSVKMDSVVSTNIFFKFSQIADVRPKMLYGFNVLVCFYVHACENLGLFSATLAIYFFVLLLENTLFRTSVLR